MKHIILYGPPAAGKLTLATELAKLTGFGVMHNHLSNNLVREIFPYGNPEFARLALQIRTQLLEAAAKARIDGVISTLVYARSTVDDKILTDWRRIVAKQGGETHFVRLHCAERTLYKRVGSSNRQDVKRIVNAKQLKAWMKQWDLYAPVAKVASLEIDTDGIKPAQAAKLVAQHYRLPMKKGRA
jgi:RNase adaptor protein for sRNA GlmZ degradation